MLDRTDEAAALKTIIEIFTRKSEFYKHLDAVSRFRCDLTRVDEREVLSSLANEKKRGSIRCIAYLGLHSGQATGAVETLFVGFKA